MTGYGVSILAAALVAGFALGLGYFAAVRRTADLLDGRSGWHAPIALTLGRIVAAVAVLALLAQLGAAALLAGFAGFLIARSLALRTARSA